MRSYSDPSLVFSSTPPPAWADRTPSSLRSPFPPRQLTPLSHSSPRGGLTGLGAPPERLGETGESDLSSLPLGNGSLLEHSLLEAMEGLEGLGGLGGLEGLEGLGDLEGPGGLGGLGFSVGLGPEDLGLPPLLPEKRTGSRGGELPSHSPSFSGFSSPHSDSSLSIPFSSPEPLRGLSRTSSPGYSGTTHPKDYTSNISIFVQMAFLLE